ncbi:MAG: carboxypeptidase-like regulatory domain-containing protein [Sandaracinaceae bacterium]|nr:carboxypeptidase-like regulatory domain-containing protein [Sandaracinaceae bacterium]
MSRSALFVLFAMLLAACDPSPEGEVCASDSDCDDGHGCTIDACNVEGRCRHEPVSERCPGDDVCVVGRGCVAPGEADAGGRADGGGGFDGGPDYDGGPGHDAGGGEDGGGGFDGGPDYDAGPRPDAGSDPDGGAGACTEGQRRCRGTSLEVCRAGAYALEQECAIDCAVDRCVTSVTCTPSAYRCNGDVVEVCNTAGSAWLYVQRCAGSCAAGLCAGACAPSETRCNGDVVEVCGAGGASWSARETCTTFCTHGSCALAGLDVAANMDLDGDLVVDGDVLVRSGATLRSPSGRLSIRARNITVQAGGSIAVVARGVGPEGAGVDGFFCTGGFNGGSGGGHGTAGTVGPTGSSGRTCTNPGPAFGSATDSAVASGGPGGGVSGSSTPGSPGGGMLRLIASSRLDIAGQVTADGQPGQRAEGSSGLSTGGGAGGGILLAGDEVLVSGAISAQGAPTGGGTWGGNGGQGRIKILSGVMRSVTGSLTGAVVTQGILPPLFVTSSTHPDSSRFYNDDFPRVTVAWERSFPSRLGHYWLVDTTRYRVPTPATGAFVADDVVGIERSALVAGDNWVHLVSVDPMSMIGTVETAFRVRVNTTPPPISSASHASESAWSTNRDAFFSWTVPQGAEHYTGFLYVLDHYGDTVPTHADTRLPITQTTLLRSGLADGIWMLHVVSIDTHGYLTRNASHRQVRIGPDPGAGGMVGQIVDAVGAAPIAGARVRVNRGIVPNQTTNATGNYNFMNVPAGTWEVDVSAPGYVTMTRSVTIADGASVPLNVSLAPM